MVILYVWSGRPLSASRTREQICTDDRGVTMEPGEIVGFVGGTIGIVKSAWDGYQWWKNRGRIDVRLLRLAYYVDRFDVGTGQVDQFPTDSSSGASML